MKKDVAEIITKCANEGCSNPVVSKPKQKPKKYCSENCKQIVWQRKKALKSSENAYNSIPEDVWKDYKEWVERFGGMEFKEKQLYRYEKGGFIEVFEGVPLPADFVNFTKVGVLNENGEVVPLDFPPNKEVKEVKPYYHFNGDQPDSDKYNKNLNEDIKNHIKEIEAEKCPSMINPASFRRSQQKRIQELRNQLET